MTTFDSSSGLVYKETTSAPVRSMIPTWSSHSSGKRKDPSKHLHEGLGCATLQSTVLRYCIWNIDIMEPEALQWLGWHYAAQLYKELKQTDTLTFNTWNILRKAFPEHLDRHVEFRVYEPGDRGGVNVPVQLPSMVDRMGKLDASMLTFLCLRNFTLNIEHLIALNRINTLATLALECGNGDGETFPTTIRDWGRSVSESGAFQKLKVLIIRTFGVSQAVILDGVSRFPALTIVGVTPTSMTMHESPEGLRHSFTDWCTAPPAYPGNMLSTLGVKTAKSVWEDKKTAMTSKMRQLYDLTTLSSQASSTQVPEYPSVSVSYLCRQTIGIDAPTIWFYRELEKPLGQSSKRPGKMTLSGGAREGPEKKRKVRDAKKMDVGSLLGTFS